jgi:Family of unknown function (DUF6763)
MATEADPIVSTWYKHLDKGQKFQVVAVDNDNLVEIQYFDGDIEEFDLDDWYLMDLEQIESPEDISGALDVSEIEDLGPSISDTNPDDWDNSIPEFKDDQSDEMIEESIEADGLNEVAPYEEPWDEL